MNPSTTLTMINLMILTLFMNLNKKDKMTKDTKMNFECGFNSISLKKMTFSLNFLMVSMMFLIFDIEITFLIPSIMTNKNKYTMMMSMCMLFISLLSIILMKEWKQGSLEWNK